MSRIKPEDMARLLGNPDPAIRFYLLAGEDEAGSRTLFRTLENIMGPDAERVDLTSSKLKDDPALLASEAASISLFGGARYIRVLVETSGDNMVDAVDALLKADVAGNPVVAIAGTLTPKAKLLKLADDSPLARACISYMPDERNIVGIVQGIAQEHHVWASPDVARMIGGMVANDRTLIANELEKIALYLDAGPDNVLEVTHGTLQKLGAETLEEDIGEAIDVTLGGNARLLQPMLTRMDATGVNEIRLIRALAIRVQMLAGLRAEVERGSSPHAVVEGTRSIFWKDKKAVKDQLGLWDAAKLSRIETRLYEAEQAIKASGTAGGILLRQLLAEIVMLGARAR